MPLGREFVPQAEAAREALLLGRLHRGIDRRADSVGRRFPERLAAVARRVAQVQHDVGDRVVVERPERRVGSSMRHVADAPAPSNGR